MTDYNFHTLNSQDLELLARDLLNAELKTIGSVSAFKSFPTGRDQGIDLLDFASSDGRYNSAGAAQSNTL